MRGDARPDGTPPLLSFKIFNLIEGFERDLNPEFFRSFICHKKGKNMLKNCVRWLYDTDMFVKGTSGASRVWTRVHVIVSAESGFTKCNRTLPSQTWLNDYGQVDDKIPNNAMVCEVCHDLPPCSICGGSWYKISANGVVCSICTDPNESEIAKTVGLNPNR